MIDLYNGDCVDVLQNIDKEMQSLLLPLRSMLDINIPLTKAK